MTEGMEAVTSAALGLALDAATLRQQAIATNIANAQTAGYVRRTTNFDQHVERLRTRMHSGGSVSPGLFSNLALRLEPASAQGDSPAVQLDAEMVDMAQNAVHYQALLKGLVRHYAILSSAVSEGKR